jgi:enoyl-CoA hydratase
MFLLKRQNGITTITLSHPPVNAISAEWVTDFHDILAEIEDDDTCSVVLIRSDQKVFCAGADLKEFQTKFTQPNSSKIFGDDTKGYQNLFERLEKLSQITIAEINGAALGGGFELALACDLRLAAEESQMGLPEGRLGLVPGAGGTQRLTKICGPGIASRIILTCEIVTGKAACDLGMVQWAESKSSLKETALALAERVAKLPAGALAASKVCIAAVNIPKKDGFKEEVAATQRLIETEDTRNRVTRFLEQNLN